ncbi:MAG: 50S ribosomal protein L17 [Deltaproteobacteria bacterium]|nr:50S ribosomal protein L17 [Deltaproteobacteria bacterium]
MAHRKLGVTSSHRQALFAHLISALILRDRIETTLPRAKALRPLAERLVTLTKRGTLHARRRAASILRDPEALQRAFATFAERFAKRQGGYTRIYKLGFRRGDSAPMALIEYLDQPKSATPAKGKKAKGTKKDAEPKAKAKKAKSE